MRLIDADTLKDSIEVHFAGSVHVYDTFAELIDEQPTIEERKQGQWLPDNNNAYETRFVCSCCKESEVVPTIGFTKYIPLWDFCPNCGAKMVTGEEA